MDTIITPVEGYIQHTQTEKGRGVFAARDYREGELIEAAPVIILTRPFESLPPKLKTIVYNWGALTRDMPRAQIGSAIALGFGSIYNHNNPANMQFTADTKNETLRYTAARDIEKYEELTVNYNSSSGHPASEQDDWFARNNIEPIVE